VKCDQCGREPATVHVTRVVNGEKTEMHLCATCAAEHGEFEFMVEPKFSIQNLLAGLLNYEGGIQSAVGPAPARSLHCEDCDLSYQDFARTGRLGCGACYRHFSQQLEPLLRRIHGSSVHAGKVPERAGKEVRLRREVKRLKEQLAQCVAQEDFEQAARLRDRIRDIERDLG